MNNDLQRVTSVLLLTFISEHRTEAFIDFILLRKMLAQLHVVLSLAVLFPVQFVLSENPYQTCKKACQSVAVSLKAPKSQRAQVTPADLSRLALEVDAKIKILSELWQMTTTTIRNEQAKKVFSLENMVGELKEEVKHTREALCPVRFNEKCFWVVLQDDIKYSDAERICSKIRGGKPANIYSADHYTLLIKHLRGIIPESKTSLYVWLGMTWNVKTEKVTLTDGSSANFVKWRINHPGSSLEYTAILLMARSDRNKSQEGIYNQNPGYQKPGVLCEA